MDLQPDHITQPRHTTSPSRKRVKKMAKTGQQYFCAKKMVLKKYRKQRFGVRKKCMPSLKHVLDPETVHTRFKHQTQQHDVGLQSDGNFSNSRSPQIEDERMTLSRLVTSSLTHTSVCSEFPISEIGSELSGNRGNGNSPFNSSNSCGSPESAVLQTNYAQRCPPQGQGSDTESSQCNNNTEQCHNCNTRPQHGCDCPVDNPTIRARDADESIIDVVSLDEEEGSAMEEDDPDESKDKTNIASNAFDMEECVDKRIPLSVDIAIAEQHSSVMASSSCRTSHRSLSRSSVSPVNWQHQFMSFLSQAPESCKVKVKAPAASTSAKSPSHSSRKRRSRKARNSTCPCCIGGSPHGKRQKHHSGHPRKHGLSREHKHFIRDMVQLVSLRNKVVTLFCNLFPQCQDLIRDMNPDCEKIDLLIDQVVDILQTPELPSPFDIDVEQDEKDTQSEATYSDSATDPLDMSEYPSLEKPDDVFFEDKDSDDMPVLDDYSADDKSQDEVEDDFLDSKEHSFSDNFVAFLGGTKERDPGGDSFFNEATSDHDQPTKLIGKSDTMECDSKNYSRAFSEGDSGILKDHDVSGPVSEWGDCSPKDTPQQGPCLRLVKEEGSQFTSKCNKSEPGVLSIPDAAESKNIKTSSVDKKFLGSFQEFLSRSVQNADNSEESEHELSCEEVEENDNKLTSCTTTNSQQQIHLPAYSDISEASRMSSPVDWTPSVGVDTQLFNKHDSKYSFLHRVNSQSLHSETDFVRELSCSKDHLPIGDIPVIDHLPISDLPVTHAGDDNRISPLSGTNCLGKDLELASTPCDTSESDHCRAKTIEIFESQVETCKQPKLCLKALKHRLNALITWLMPATGAKLGNAYFKSADNLEYLLDVLIYCNTCTATDDDVLV